MQSGFKWKILAGNWNLAYKWLATTKAFKVWFKVWFSYSHNCTLASGAVCHSVCQVWLSSGPPGMFTLSYCAWLWNWCICRLFTAKLRSFTWVNKLIFHVEASSSNLLGNFENCTEHPHNECSSKLIWTLSSQASSKLIQTKWRQ